MSSEILNLQLKIIKKVNIRANNDLIKLNRDNFKLKENHRFSSINLGPIVSLRFLNR